MVRLLPLGWVVVRKYGSFRGSWTNLMVTGTYGGEILEKYEELGKVFKVYFANEL